MQNVLSHIESFGAEEFIAVMIKQIDSGQNLDELLRINKKGINNGNFIHMACVELEKFLNNYPYSRENLEKFFKIRFCDVRSGRRLNQNMTLSFENGAKWGKDVIFITKKEHKDRPPTVNYVRLDKMMFK